MLEINPETVCFLILKAHQYDVKAEPAVLGDSAHPIDDEVLEDLDARAGDAVVADPIYEEMKSFIEDMNEDAQIDVVALMWLGRDGVSADDWRQVRAEAARARNEHSAEYLLGTPLLADYLSEGLNCLGYDCEDYRR
ncbi:DUF3775 domain-containing protein [Pelagibius sp. Alg239-R121]|uniref:DUF3775 domain-containing protein n=1 Tax=Pelagibius sp. Alg239-R121 TaxID=2993448 RepID=UPI0024A75340|nr:DUF3775 domain-containing protein [Pelagibius sp. Alg239-R121]